MVCVRTIKDIDEDSWATFKSLAAKNKMKMGDMFKEMIESYNNSWNTVFNNNRIFSEKEAEEIKKIVASARKEKGFRK